MFGPASGTQAVTYFTAAMVGAPGHLRRFAQGLGCASGREVRRWSGERPGARLEFSSRAGFVGVDSSFNSKLLVKETPAVAANLTTAASPEHQGKNKGENKGDGAPLCEVVFIAHLPDSTSGFSLLSRDTQPTSRWASSLWMRLAWPFTFSFSLCEMFVAPALSGPYRPYGRFQYMGATHEQWLARAVGYQYMIKPLRPRIARGIEAAVRKADKAGVSVMGLGALNKAEWINGGGEDVLEALQPLNLRLVHGNTLTAAVVIENIKAAAKSIDFDSESSTSAPCVFLTGPTSKIGRATALKLALEGYDVICCTTSEERFAALEQELVSLQEQRQESSARMGTLSMAGSVEEGARFKLWAVGKYDPSVRDHIPQKASAVVFSVPCPLDGGYRPDVSKVDGGILLMDTSSCTPRTQHCLLPHDQMYSCQAGALVHHLKGWTHHETGKIHMSQIDTTLQAAYECGFALPPSSSGSG